MLNQDRLKIAVVGAGSIGAKHIQAISENKACSLSGIADIAEERARTLAQANHTNWYSDYKEMYETEKPDAVIVNLPHGLHCEAAEYFLNKNVHVLMEKPMANSLAECDRMIEAERKSKAKLAIGHVQRYFEAHRYLRERVLDSSYGDLRMISEVRNTDYFTSTRPRWFLDKKAAGGGIMMNLGAHSIDKLLYIVGGDIASVHALVSEKRENGSIEGQVQMLIGLRDGISASIMLNGYSHNFYEQYFYFDKATIKVVNTRELFVDIGSGYVKVPIGEMDMLGQQLTEFIAYIQGKESEVVTPQYARKVIEVIEEVYRQNGLLSAEV